MKDIDFKIDDLGRFIQKDLDKYESEIGILEDKPAAKWKGPQRTLYGGPANKQAGQNKETTLRALMAKFNNTYNILLAPWQSAENKDVLRVIDRMVADINKGGKMKQSFLNAMQAVVRNPILRGDYGDNTKATEATKGFNRLMINTGKFFSNIKVRFTKHV